MIKIDKKNPTIKDSRGSIIEFDTKSLEQVNILFSKENTVRGNHYHKVLEESFYVLEGQFILELFNIKSNDSYSIEINSGDFFKILPFINHTLRFKSDTQIIVGYSKKFDPNDTDIYNI